MKPKIIADSYIGSRGEVDADKLSLSVNKALEETIDSEQPRFRLKTIRISVASDLEDPYPIDVDIDGVGDVLGLTVVRVVGDDAGVYLLSGASISWEQNGPGSVRIHYIDGLDVNSHFEVTLMFIGSPL